VLRDAQKHHRSKVKLGSGGFLFGARPVHRLREPSPRRIGRHGWQVATRFLSFSCRVRRQQSNRDHKQPHEMIAQGHGNEVDFAYQGVKPAGPAALALKVNGTKVADGKMKATVGEIEKVQIDVAPEKMSAAARKQIEATEVNFALGVE
jgi:hypothetical protein